MPQVKLFGLVLIITTLILAMAVVVTETFEIRLYDPSAQATGAGQSNGTPTDFPNPGIPNNSFPQSPQGGMDSNNSGAPLQQASAPHDPQFVSVPVIVPLGIAGALGTLLWFAPGSANTKKASTSKYKRNQKR